MKFLNAAQICFIIQTLAWMASGSFHYNNSKKFMAQSNSEEEPGVKKEYNRELIDPIFDYLKWTLDFLLVLRFALLIGA